VITLHLIRHASHDLLGKVLVGRTAVPLSPRGEQEAAAVAASLAATPLAAVISSPQLRAWQTAAAVAARHATEPRIEPGIDEIDFGAWTGASFSSLAEDDGWHAFNHFRSAAAVPKGESMLAAQARALEAAHRLAREFCDAEIALVSHADIIKAILAHFLGSPLDLLRRMEILPASHSIVVLHPSDAVITLLNQPVRIKGFDAAPNSGLA
jgi:broad specificity phosphatase PhoE